MVDEARVVEARTNLWRALIGRRPEALPPTDGDADLWQRITDRINPAKARPRIRDGIERVELESLRTGPYVMFRSPDHGGESAYARLAPEEAALTAFMDGNHTVAQLVGEFARISGRLAPDQVTRVVADLAAGRMLDQLPVNAFHPLERITPRPWPVRLGKALLRGLAGRRVVIANPDRAVGLLHRWGGWLLFTRAAAVLMTVTALTGLVLWLRMFTGGAQSAFLVSGSYGAGAAALVILNLAGLLVHETGHALATKHAGRRVPAVGFLCYFGLPSAFVDTTDMWMAGRKQRIVASAAGPGFALTFAGALQVAATVSPDLAPLAFKLGLVWYTNALFNLNPLMALDGYYVFMDWLEVPNLRSRAVAFVAAVLRRPRILLRERRGEARLIAYYAAGSLLWLVVMTSSMFRMYRDRFGSWALASWSTGWPARVLMIATAAMLASPVVYALAGWVSRLPRRVAAFARRKLHEDDAPIRLLALRDTVLGKLPDEQLQALADSATWLKPRRGSEVQSADSEFPGVVVVIEGALEGRRPGDPSGYIRARAGEGDAVGVPNVSHGVPSSLAWAAAGTRLLVIPAEIFRRVVGSVGGKAPASRAEAETLLDESPAFAGISPEEREVLLGAIAPVDLHPGQAARLPEGVALLVGSGVLELPDGSEVRRGDLVGPPVGEDLAIRSRSRARVWKVPVAGPTTLSLGRDPHHSLRVAAHTHAVAGVHGDADEGPLVLPWGTPPPDGDAEAVDRGLARRFLALLALLVVVAVLAFWFALSPGNAWSELPNDRAVLDVESGQVDVIVDDERERKGAGDTEVVERSDEIVVAAGSLARLTFRGGAEAVLCPSTSVEIGRLGALGTSPLRPTAELVQRSGEVVADTDSPADGADPLALRITLVLGGDTTREIANDGAAVFSTSRSWVQVTTGTVVMETQEVPADGERLTCGGGGDRGEVGGVIVEAPGVSGETSTTSSSTPPTSIVASTPTTTARATTTSAPGQSGPGPVIDSFTVDENPVVCASSTTIRLAWTTMNAVEAVVSIDGPGAFGTYPADGNADVPFACDGSSHAYTLTAVGADGRTVTSTRVVEYGGAPTTTTADLSPTIDSYTVDENPVACGGGVETIRLTWSTTNATEVVVSIDGPGAYGTYPADGSADVPFACGESSHTYTITANGPDGSTARTITVNRA